MGGTGSGKSVLLKSLVRIYDPTQGCIEINGEDIRQFELDDLRNKFAYVFQDVFLFSNTIDANIAFYAPYAAKEEVVRVADLAQAGRFIRALPHGFETIVGEKGLGLSGGQKQRISIARALLKNAPVLVFDDASSASGRHHGEKPDEEHQGKLSGQDASHCGAPRFSVADCDEILYMQDGEIIERGTFDQLIAANGRFAAIYKMQTSEEGKKDDFSDEILASGREE